MGDHPAQDFERGTQKGGTYKCGSCGINTNMITDFAHAGYLEWRTLSTIQSIALKGHFGKQPGFLKPFATLLVSDLKNKLSVLQFEPLHDLKGHLVKMFDRMCYLQA